MKSYLVVEDPKDWPEPETGVEIVLAQDYLTNSAYSQTKTAKVFNLCRSYKYQSVGYYVSLLAAARGHKPLPSVSTVVDFRLVSLMRLAGETLSDLIRKSLAPLQSDEFVLSIYFGKNLAKRHDQLSARLFRLYPAPLIRCAFGRDEEGWKLKGVRPIALTEVPESHRDALYAFARDFFEKRHVPRAADLATSRYSLAILRDPNEQQPPSNKKAISRLSRVAAKLGVGVEIITRDDYGRLAEFDALFIRDTTNVNHYTFRFARRAQAEGLAVIDDPDSILRCSNKVYLAELLARARIATPRTVLVTRGNLESMADEIPFPCILKQPDSAFSLGVKKAESFAEFRQLARQFLESSELIVVQEFLPTDFDWRVGILDGQPLYVCKYHMARSHWQIVQRDGNGNTRWGRTETVPLWQAPPPVVRIALQAANLIGTGLYGVDVKETERGCAVIEVNDNPDIYAGIEDAELKDALYERIVNAFVRRIEKRREGLTNK